MWPSGSGRQVWISIKKELRNWKPGSRNACFFFFKQKTAYDIGLGIPAEPLFRSYSIVIGSKHITLNATGGGFLTASKQFRHGATSKSRSNTASNSTKHKSPHLSGWRQIISLIT